MKNTFNKALFLGVLGLSTLSFAQTTTTADAKAEAKQKAADEKAVSEYAEFNKTQKIVSDFDKEVKKLLQGGEGGNE